MCGWLTTTIQRYSPTLPRSVVSPVLPYYVCILGMCRARDPHFQPWISVPEHIIFKISLLSSRSSPPMAGSARTQSVRQRRGLTRPSWQFRRLPFSRWKRIKLVPEPPIFKLKTAQARSGAPHFHARPGARSGDLAHFSLCRGTRRSTKIWGEYPRGRFAPSIWPQAVEKSWLRQWPNLLGWTKLRHYHEAYNTSLWHLTLNMVIPLWTNKLL